jgi:hypothetical protein
MKDFVLWHGPSALDGAPVVLVGRAKGNGKTQGKRALVGLAVIPVQTVAAMLRATADGVEGSQLGSHYRRSIVATIASACGASCNHRDGLTCYVQHSTMVAGEPATMARNACADGLPPLGWSDAGVAILGALVGAGSAVRFMVAGSTAALPVDVAARLTDIASDATIGYVEEWRNRPDLRDSHMASCQTLDDAREAQASGWRVFLSGMDVPQDGSDAVLPSGFALCPSSKWRERIGRESVPCTDCMLCNGAKPGDARKNILNPPHGPGQTQGMQWAVKRGEYSGKLADRRGRIIGRVA